MVAASSEARDIAPADPALTPPESRIVVASPPGADNLPAEIDVAGALARLAQIRELIAKVMIWGVHYGPVPEAPASMAPMVYNEGVQFLDEVYGYVPEYELVNPIEEWGAQPFFNFKIRCTLFSKRTGAKAGEGLGSCNSREARFFWRQGQRTCPACEQPAVRPTKARACPKCKRVAVLPSRDQGAFWCDRRASGCGENFRVKTAEATALERAPQQQAGWWCNAKQGGCGENFAVDSDADRAIKAQVVGRVENPDLAGQHNNVLKQATIRAHRAATLAATRSAGLFSTQDGGGNDDEEESRRLASDRQRGGEAPTGPTGGATATTRTPPAKAAAPVVNPERTTEVKIGEKTYKTAGVTADTLKRLWDAARDYDKVHGEGAHKAFLRDKFQRPSTMALTEHEALAAIAAIGRVLEPGTAELPLGDRNADDDIPFPT